MKMGVRSTPFEREYVLKGDFTFADENVFFNVYQSVKTQTEKHVVYNFEECSFIDSAAMGMLLVAFEEADKRRRVQYIRFASPQVREILHLAGVDRYFRFQNAK